MRPVGLLVIVKLLCTSNSEITLDLQQDTVQIRFSQHEDGSLGVAFPNAEVIETDEGPMMGFYCDANSAVFIGGSIIHAGFELIGQDREDEDGEIHIPQQE